VLLQQAGVDFEVSPPDVDDGALTPGAVDCGWWAMAMSYLKGSDVARRLRAAGVRSGTVLAADTACGLDGRIIGQPADAAHARRTLVSFREREHAVVSGVTLLCLATGARLLFVDRAVVRWGAIDDATIDAYVAGGTWQGKAGAYNLVERIEAGWPIECRGDPATVMGLPMEKLLRLL
jgi:septum formation protein